MFDPTTERLIASAPVLREVPEQNLAGVDPSALARELSAAFAELAAIRLKLRGQEFKPEPDIVHLAATVRRLMRIANTYEARIIISEAAVDRAAAFVTGVCRQIIFDTTQLNPSEIKASFIRSRSISSDIVSALLFLASESHADAQASADRISGFQQNPVRSDLVFLVQSLCRAQFAAITTWETTVGLSEVVEDMGDFDLQEIAADHLFYMLPKRIIDFSHEMLGEREIGSAEGIFNTVRAIAAQQDEIPGFGRANFLLPGPHHLACLLLLATSGLGELALVRTRLPSGLGANDPDEAPNDHWQQSLKRLAQRRPLIWRNHRGAIDGGLLDIGTSAVMNFPTGAGKSTLASLKITATYLKKKSTIYLAPTHALCDQVSTELDRDLAGIGQIATNPFEEISIDDIDPVVYVMTPEQCLAGIAFRKEFFSSIGLLVFDECHLLHPSASRGSRRSLDAMLTLLAFIDLCPESDVLLLSAMIKNAQELADWLNSIGKFPCVAFEDPWKPTRQARAAILYRDTEIRLAKQQHHERPIAEAFGVFNLVRGWNPNDPNSIILQSLLPNNVTLARGKYGITANRNIVAGEIAAATQIPGDILNPKVLVFAENKVAVHSIANMLNKKTIRTVPKITPEEAVYQRIIMAEFGDDYFPLNPLSAKVGVHYGNMLPCERSYAESMFRRTGGYNILVATSTLAQGLNLPCEIVVMAGTDRYDDAFDDPGREDIPVYELLNALGRAGRAGSAAAGVSIVVPGKVITFKDDDVKSLSNNDSLKNIFFGSDNCLNVDDPLTSILLDKLEVESARKSRDFQHALYRLRLSLQSDEKGVVGGFIANSLGAFRARRKGDIEWPVKRAALAAMLLTETVDPLVLGWRDQIAAHAGLPVLAVRTLEEEFNTRWVPDTLYVEDVIKIVIDCLTCERLHLFDVIRLENVERVFGVKIEGVDADIFINHAREVIRKGIYAWCSGKTIGDIERTIFPTVYNFKKIYKNKPRKMQKDWPTARNFVLNMVSDIGFGASVLSQIASALRIDTESGVARAEAISMAGSAIRYGFTSVEQIILASIVKNQLSRVEIHLAEKFLISSGELINARLDVDRSQIYWKIKGLIGKYGGVEGLLDKIKPA